MAEMNATALPLTLSCSSTLTQRPNLNQLPPLVSKSSFVGMIKTADPRFSHLFRTNVVPSDIEMREIQETMSQERTRISLLELQIKNLDASLEKLIIEREKCCTRLETFKTVLAPVRRLPPELVIEIFRLYCPTRTTLLPSEYSNLPQLVISQICSGWRKVALELNELWNCVSFQSWDSDSNSNDRNNSQEGSDSDSYVGSDAYDDSDNSDDERVIEAEISQANINLVDLWFSRSGSLPLDLEFWYDNCDIADEPIQHILLPRVQRCRIIKLHMPRHSLQPFFDLPVDSLNMLESLTVSPNGLGLKVPFWPSVTSSVRSAPRLSSLYFECDGLMQADLHFMTMSIPWSQLTRFWIHSLTSSPDSLSILDILRQCVNLVECSVHLWMAYGNENAPILVLPHLRRLHLGEGNATLLLRFLTLPALEEIDINLRERSSLEIFSSLVSRSAFNLQKLWLSGERQRDRLKEILLRAPGVLFLSLEGSICSDDLESIARYELVSRVQTIRLPFYTTTAKDVLAQFLAMIESRRPRRSDMNEVNASPQGSFRARLKCLILVGCTITRMERRLRRISDVDIWRKDGLDVRFEP